MSSLKVKKPDRGLKKLLNGLLRSEPMHSEECGEFTLSELNVALKSLNPSKALGPDMIHPRLLHHLGPIAVNTLLRICNLSWSTMEIPQAGRVADVRPVLNLGKDAQCLDSYRPISLTSTMGKVMERLVTNRLRYFAECHNLLTPFQAGFRTGRSKEDQLLRLSQFISDGFQHVLMQRMVIALIDYSRAYDKVWRDALLFKMQQLGVPTMMLRWVQAWLFLFADDVAVWSQASGLLQAEHGYYGCRLQL